MKKLISLRIEPGLKLFIEEHASKDRRNFSSFVLNATLKYIKNNWDADWEEVRLDYIERAEKDNSGK